MPTFTFHSLTVPSLLPEAKSLPSGLKARERTRSVCPLRIASFLPLATSHDLIIAPLVLPEFAEATVLPSGLNASHRIMIVSWGLPPALGETNLAVFFPVATSQ